MITRCLFLVLALILGAPGCQGQRSQSKFNLHFDSSKDSDFPTGWIKWGMPDFSVHLDSINAYSGRFAALISPLPDAKKGHFGSVAYRLPAHYEGMNVTLEGYMKIEGVRDGFAGLLLRIDGDNNRVLAFDNMQDQKIQGSHAWKKYAITLPLKKGAERIYVAGILVGKGKAWFDSFDVFIDGTPIEEAEVVTRPVAKAELDKEFDAGSGISIPQLSSFQESSLYTLGKVWGFLKYHHPVIQQGELNWDYELFRVMPAVLQAKSKEDVNDIIAGWISAIGPVAKLKTPSKAIEEEIKLKPDIDWISNPAELGRDVTALLQTVKAQERDTQGYYVSFTPGIGNPQFHHEDVYGDVVYSDDGFGLLSLFRYWNMIEYFFPYKHLTDENWDHVLHDFIPRMVNVSDELSYKLTLLELIGKVQDTHANIWMRDPILEVFWGSKMAPVKLTFVEDRVVVARFLNTTFEQQTSLRVGDVITHINGTPVAQVIEEKLRYCPASNLPTQYRDVMRKLLRSNEDSLRISVSDGQQQREEMIPLLSFQSLNMRTETPSHQWLDDIGYIYPASLKKGEITDIMEKFEDSRGLIIDLRCYPSDFIVFSLGSYLMSEPTPFAKFTTGGLQNPGQFTFTKPLEVGKSRKDYYKGKVVIIVNETTQSQAEYTTMALRVAPNAVVIGSTTAGADGNVSEIYLPGNVRTLISGIGVYYPDGKETQRIGIVPDIKMRPTIEGIREGTDELLEKAISLIKGT